MGSRTLDSKTSSFRICVEYLTGKVQTISKVNKLLISQSLPTFCGMLVLKRTMRIPRQGCPLQDSGGTAPAPPGGENRGGQLVLR